MSAGPGAYLEPEAAAAQIAAGRQGRGFDSDDEQGDVLGDAVLPPPTRPKDGSPSKAAANGDGGATPMDVSSSGDAGEQGGINVGGGDPNDPACQRRIQLEQVAREEEIRRLAQLEAAAGGGLPYGGYDGMGGPAAAAAAAAAAAGYGADGVAGGYMGGDASVAAAAAAAAGYGRARRNSFEASDKDPSSGSDSDDEEAEVDWEDSADEDVDAATAAAMEQARIGMARAAARELRESRATRWVLWWW